jgi:hypothetical protein
MVLLTCRCNWGRSSSIMPRWVCSGGKGLVLGLVLRVARRRIRCMGRAEVIRCHGMLSLQVSMIRVMILRSLPLPPFSRDLQGRGRVPPRVSWTEGRRNSIRAIRLSAIVSLLFRRWRRVRRITVWGLRWRRGRLVFTWGLEDVEAAFTGGQGLRTIMRLR